MAGIRANGSEREVPDAWTIDDLIRSYDLRPQWVVVELNGAPVERARYAGVQLRTGDRIEIVRAVAGG